MYLIVFLIVRTIFTGNFQTDMLLSGLGLSHIWTIPVAAHQVPAQAQAQAQAPVKDMPNLSERESITRHGGSGILSQIDHKAASSSKEIQGKPDGKYEGWYPTLPCSSLVMAAIVAIRTL